MTLNPGEVTDKFSVRKDPRKRYASEMHGTCEGESNTEAVYMQRYSYIAILLAILSRTMYYRLRNIEKKN